MSTQLSPITPDVHVVGGIPKTNSLNIAEAFGKPHKDVLERYRKLDCSPGFTERNFSPSDYIDPTGRKLPMVEMTRNGFMFMVMGFTGAKAAQIKEAYINRFDEMEAQLHALPIGLALPEGPLTLDVKGRLQDSLNALQAALDAKPLLLTGEEAALLGVTPARLALALRLRESQDKQEAKHAGVDLVIEMARQGKTRAEIMAATGKSSNLVRQTLWQARQNGLLPM